MVRSGLVAALLFAVALLVPNVVAGTEAEPEIIDREGNVIYDENYPGSQDHDYLDLLGMWWTYDPASDAVSFHLKGVDFSTYAGTTGPDVKAKCWLAVQLVAGDRVEQLGARWSQYTYGGEFFSDVNVSRAPDPAVPLEHQLTRGFEAPGYLTWTIGRQLLLRYGDVLKAPATACVEEYFPAGVDPSQTVAGTVKIFGASPITNRNPNLRGEATLNLSALAPTEAVESSDLPTAAAVNGATSDVGGERSPNVGSLGLVMLVAGAAFLRRRSLR
jgi:hypothetical protein